MLLLPILDVQSCQCFPSFQRSVFRGFLSYRRASFVAPDVIAVVAVDLNVVVVHVDVDVVVVEVNCIVEVCQLVRRFNHKNFRHLRFSAGFDLARLKFFGFKKKNLAWATFTTYVREHKTDLKVVIEILLRHETVSAIHVQLKKRSFITGV